MLVFGVLVVVAPLGCQIEPNTAFGWTNSMLRLGGQTMSPPDCLSAHGGVWLDCGKPSASDQACCASCGLDAQCTFWVRQAEFDVCWLYVGTEGRIDQVGKSSGFRPQVAGGDDLCVGIAHEQCAAEWDALQLVERAWLRNPQTAGNGCFAEERLRSCGCAQGCESYSQRLADFICVQGSRPPCASTCSSTPSPWCTGGGWADVVTPVASTPRPPFPPSSRGPSAAP
eukprot:Hpha_TRINITY_DN12846_c0_g4::TRINITY_DN12846_c0_g4_i1::g.24187::m.24187